MDDMQRNMEEFRKSSMRSYVARTYRTVEFLFSFSGSIYVAIVVIYMHDLEMPVADIALILAFSLALQFVLEVPAGVFADKYGRDLSVRAAYISFFLAPCIFLLAYPFPKIIFPIAIVGELFLAAGYAFKSGAIEAWVVGNAKHNGLEDKDLDELFGSQFTYLNLGLLTGGSLGLLLYALHPVFPWAICLTGMFVTALIGWIHIRDTPDLEQYHAQNKGVGIWKDAILYVCRRDNRELLIVFVTGASLYVLGYYVSHFFILYIKTSLQTVDPTFIPLFWLIVMSARIIGNTLVRKVKIDENTSRRRFLAMALTINILSILVLYPVFYKIIDVYINHNIVILCMIVVLPVCLSRFGEDLQKPILSSTNNMLIRREELRATVLSLRAGLGSFFIFFIYLLLMAGTYIGVWNAEFGGKVWMIWVIISIFCIPWAVICILKCRTLGVK